ncbi:putative protein [BD1-7 clade bacterium]|uniref:Polyketide cyclase / dehydrase and lipid transport n=1 Tax=BD1-7 clade bacterium TaxID=2029982 RepID=A0A5S9NZ48_9GAMM|nr:putative protein [BD1-7 clade bacterium]CAA0096118.1 putative protein [BD1-7 clade bacterium]
MKVKPCLHKSAEELHQAPVLIENTIEIDCSAERLFAIFEDEHAWTVWGSSLEEVIWTSPKPFGVGTTRTVKMAGGIMGVEQFTAWETNRRMAFCFTESSMPNMAAFGEDYVVESLGENRCKLVWYAAFWPSNAFATGCFKVLKPVMTWYLGSFLKGLKKLCEGDYQPRPASPRV